MKSLQRLAVGPLGAALGMPTAITEAMPIDVRGPDEVMTVHVW